MTSLLLSPAAFTWKKKKKNWEKFLFVFCQVRERAAVWIYLCGGVGNGGEQTERLSAAAAGSQDGGGGIGEAPATPIGRRVVLFEGRLQVANVVDDVLDHFQFGDFPVLGHVRHKFLQFRQVHLDLHLLLGRRRWSRRADRPHRIHSGRRRMLSFHHFTCFVFVATPKDFFPEKTRKNFWDNSTTSLLLFGQENKQNATEKSGWSLTVRLPSSEWRTRALVAALFINVVKLRPSALAAHTQPPWPNRFFFFFFFSPWRRASVGHVPSNVN